MGSIKKYEDFIVENITSQKDGVENIKTILNSINQKVLDKLNLEMFNSSLPPDSNHRCKFIKFYYEDIDEWGHKNENWMVKVKWTKNSKTFEENFRLRNLPKRFISRLHDLILKTGKVDKLYKRLNQS